MMQEFTDQTAPHQLPFESFGVEIRLCTNHPELLTRVEPLMPPGWKRRPRTSSQHRVGLMSEDHDVYSVYHNDICVHDAQGLDFALMMLDSQLQGYVALESPDFIFVHAGVVAENERAIVLPGMSFSGKSTLVRALVEAGATYFSDEFAVLDADGRVHPYPKPLTYRPPDDEPPVDYRIEQLGGTIGERPLEVGLVVSTRYKPGAEWDPEPLSSAAAVLSLMENTVPARTRPKQTMRVLRTAVEGSPALKGLRGEADSFAPRLLDALRSHA